MNSSHKMHAFILCQLYFNKVDLKDCCEQTQKPNHKQVSKGFMDLQTSHRNRKTSNMCGTENIFFLLLKRPLPHDCFL